MKTQVKHRLAFKQNGAWKSGEYPYEEFLARYFILLEQPGVEIKVG